MTDGALRRRRTRWLAVATSALFVVAGVLLADSARAAFVDVPETGAPGRLVLSSDPYPAEFLSLAPGEPAHWLVNARLEDASRAELSLELRKSGELAEHPRGLRMTVQTCDVPWSEDAVPVCAGSARTVTVAAPEDDYATTSPVFALEPLAAGTPRHLMVTLALASDPGAAADESLMGLRGDMALGLTAVTIDDVPVGPGGGELPVTGPSPLALLAAVALGLGLVGVGLLTRLRRQGGMS
ncbi:hypothetical protein [Microbacterium sp.]|uniref:hypothetical protein n=1 Tax=Microbacterium sp. TaxID=51671 RepID=UPI0037C5EEF2